MVELQFIGHIESPFLSPEGMPIQPVSKNSKKGKLIIKPEFAPGLKSLDGFTHIYAIYYLHKISDYDLEVVPFLGDQKHGIFATRAPKRPNKIGLSVLEIEKIEGNVIHVSNIDILNDTPILDVKPFVHDFDVPEKSSMGWYEKAEKKAGETQADNRFIEKSK